MTLLVPGPVSKTCHLYTTLLTFAMISAVSLKSTIIISLKFDFKLVET